uniref:Uncharacterized protein n=1 Tax=Euplotes crassus TaxID=5936 RepID=A0A7S3K5D5_EUPCR|mmetsp:Transcript_10111/g.9967  ORF Transcript_10111/g.9967 Transcript_10111/m.9967 type:complete len:171 (+) Transcript_10111:188-700(+)
MISGGLYWHKLLSTMKATLINMLDMLNKFKNKLREWKDLPFVLKKEIAVDQRRKSTYTKVFTSVEPHLKNLDNHRGKRIFGVAMPPNRTTRKNTDKGLNMTTKLLSVVPQPTCPILRPREEESSFIEESEIADHSEIKRSSIRFSIQEISKKPEMRKRYRRNLRNKIISK